MKLVIAIIRSENLDAVRACLSERDSCILSMFEVLSDGPEPHCTGSYRGQTFAFRPPKLRLDIATRDALIDDLVAAIVRAGYPLMKISRGGIGRVVAT